MLEFISSVFSPPGAKEAHRSVINEGYKGMLVCFTVQLTAQSVAQCKGTSQLPSNSFGIRSHKCWLIIASAHLCMDVLWGVIEGGQKASRFTRTLLDVCVYV
ncbi:hypothetical protein XENOCAPTIV_024149 [Xenoophorus captivus]|uniref:Uncharacterized protein n=1 Tax=Xenoophorus captivus TaxID=1517983 RepID=A0ABV0QLF2_9TELE